MKAKTTLLTALLLIATASSAWAQTGDIVTMTTKQPTVKINAEWTGTGTISANGVDLENNIRAGSIIPVTAGKVTLTVTGTAQLTMLHCYDNALTVLDISGCSALEMLLCFDNQLSFLDVSGRPALKHLSCYNNQLITLNVSSCPALEILLCFDNQLSTLNVIGCTALRSLLCSNNQLTGLDVSGCTALEHLFCEDNQLSTLNVSGCTELIRLWLRAQNQSIAVPPSGDDYRNPVCYTDKAGQVVAITIDGKPYAQNANLPLPSVGNTLQFSVDSFSGTITLTGYSPSSIEEVGRPVLFAYPNPTNGMVTVSGLTPGVAFYVYSNSGSLVGTYTAEGEEMTINLSRLRSGMYYLNTEGKIFKIIKN